MYCVFLGLKFYIIFVYEIFKCTIMKTIIILCLIYSASIFNLSAQNIEIWTFGVEAGINYSNSSENTYPLKKKCPILPRIGITVDYKLSTNFGMQSGIFYAQKGLKSKGDTEQIKASVELNQHVIQVPILVTYLNNFSDKFLAGMGAGVYWAHGVGGKTKAYGTVGGQLVDKNLRTFDSILKKNDIGLNFKVFTEYNHYMLNLAYEYGLINIGKSNVMGNNLDYENRVLSVTLSYRF